jgi:tRNA G18 (ribose-2'-O)-methylase SpoU
VRWYCRPVSSPIPADPVLSADDPRVQSFRAPHRDPADGRIVAEGELVVRRLLAAPRFRVRGVLATPSALVRLGDALAGCQAPVYTAAPAVMAAIAGFRFHRGCLAFGEERAACDLASVLAGTAGRPALLVGLDRVTDADNLGTIVRSARVFGAAAVLLSPGCAPPYSAKALRASMGGALALPVVRTAGWAGALGRVAAAGFDVLGLTPHGVRDVRRLAGTGPRVALLCGNEWDGLGPESLAAGGSTVRIALAPGADSLNVAAAAAIALHALAADRG